MTAVAYVLALLSSLFLGVSDFTGGFLSKRASEFAVAGASAAVAASMFLVIGVGTGKLELNRIDVTAGILGGIFLMVGTVLYFRALAKGRMGVIGGTATLLVLIPLISDIVAGNTPSTLSLVGIAITIGGVILLGAPEMRGGTGLGPVFLAAIAAVFLGLQQLATSKGSAQNVLGTLVVTELVVLAIIVAIGLFARSNGGLSRKAIPLILIVGVTDALSVWTFSKATTGGDIAIVSVLSALDPIVISLLAVFFLKEKLSKLQVVAILIVILGGVVLALGGSSV